MKSNGMISVLVDYESLLNRYPDSPRALHIPAVQDHPGFRGVRRGEEGAEATQAVRDAAQVRPRRACSGSYDDVGN